MPHKQAKPFVGGYNPGLIARPRANRSLPEKLTCATCKKSLHHDSFSGHQIDNIMIQTRRTPSLVTTGKYDIRCTKCTPGSVSKLTCVECNTSMPLDKFSKAQRRTPDEAVCMKCMDITLAFKPDERVEGTTMGNALDEGVDKEEGMGKSKFFTERDIWDKNDDNDSGGIALPIESSNASVVASTAPHIMGKPANKRSHAVDLHAVSAALSAMVVSEIGDIQSQAGTEDSLSNLLLATGSEAWTGASELDEEVYRDSDGEDDIKSVITERGFAPSVPALTRLTTRVDTIETLSSIGDAETNVGGVRILLPEHKEKESTLQYTPLRIDQNAKPIIKQVQGPIIKPTQTQRAMTYAMAGRTMGRAK